MYKFKCLKMSTVIKHNKKNKWFTTEKKQLGITVMIIFKYR